jgi:glycosyl transferase, family 25
MSIKIKSIEDITNIFYINLEHRVDRKIHVENQLLSVGLTGFQRFNAIKMSNGAIGCSMSHLKILENALTNNLDHVLIVEDDITFTNIELFKSQLNKFLQTDSLKWDVILFAGNNMPPYQPVPGNFCVKVTKCQTTTGYLVNGYYIKVLLNNIRMGLTHLLSKPEQHSLFAIDKFWFVLQQNGNWYLITPLTVIQREDYSDIEQKITKYSDLMLDLDKKELFEAIRLHKIGKLTNQNKPIHNN